MTDAIWQIVLAFGDLLLGIGCGLAIGFLLILLLTPFYIAAHLAHKRGYKANNPLLWR